MSPSPASLTIILLCLLTELYAYTISNALSNSNRVRSLCLDAFAAPIGTAESLEDTVRRALAASGIKKKISL